MSAGLSPTRRPWDSAPGFVDCPIRGRGQDRVGQRSLLEGPLSECFLKKGSQEEAVSLKPSRDRAMETVEKRLPREDDSRRRVFPPFPQRLENSSGRSFPQFPPLLRLNTQQSLLPPLRGEGFTRD